jgi:small-conductance mechanosensitive channel
MEPVDLLGGLGLGSLAVGFAFKDILQNWLAGLLILLRLPFRRGDQIEVIGLKGTVLRIEPRATIMRTYDGKDIVIPNTTIYTNDVTIQTSQPTRRIEMDITVGYENDIDRIRDILTKALEKVDEIRKDPPPQILCWELGATSLGIKLRWWISSERSQEVISRARAVEAIKKAFAANDIDPTDPSLVYSVNMAPPAKSTSSDKDKLEMERSTAGDPTSIQMDADDPETYTAKMDDKADTLLSEDSGVK